MSEMQIRQNVCMQVKKVYCKTAHAFKIQHKKATNLKLKKYLHKSSSRV